MVQNGQGRCSDKQAELEKGSEQFGPQKASLSQAIWPESLGWAGSASERKPEQGENLTSLPRVEWGIL